MPALIGWRVDAERVRWAFAELGVTLAVNGEG